MHLCGFETDHKSIIGLTPYNNHLIALSLLYTYVYMYKMMEIYLKSYSVYMCSSTYVYSDKLDTG